MLVLQNKGTLPKGLSTPQEYRVCAKPDVGKRETGVPCSPGERLNDSKGQLAPGVKVSSNMSHDLYAKGFVEQHGVNCLIETESVKTILSSKVYDRLQQYKQFLLRNENTDIFLADGSTSRTRGTGETILTLGRQEWLVSFVVADIEDDVILGMDLLSQAGASIDLVQGKVNGKAMDCYESRNQLLSYLCMVHRSVIVESNSEVIFPVTIVKRIAEPTPPYPGPRCADFGAL